MRIGNLLELPALAGSVPAPPAGRVRLYTRNGAVFMMESNGVERPLVAEGSQFLELTDSVRAPYVIATREFSYPASDLEAGTINGNKLRLDGLNMADGTAADASLTSTTHGLQIGTDNGFQLRMDANEIIAVDGRTGTVKGSTLILQKDTGSFVDVYDEGLRSARQRAKHLYLGTEQSTTSTTYTNLTTVGPAVNFKGPPSGEVQIRLGFGAYNATAAAVNYMAYEMRVNSTRKDANGVLLPAVETDPVDTVNFGATSDSRACYVNSLGFTHTTWFGDDVPCTVGAEYIVTAKYRVTAGTGFFRHRRISAQPQL